MILDEIKKNKTITMQDLLEKLKEKYPTLTLTSCLIITIFKNITISGIII